MENNVCHQHLGYTGQTGHWGSVQAGKIGKEKVVFPLSINLLIFNNLRKQERETRRAQVGSLCLRNVQQTPQNKTKQKNHLRPPWQITSFSYIKA